MKFCGLNYTYSILKYFEILSRPCSPPPPHEFDKNLNPRAIVLGPRDHRRHFIPMHSKQTDMRVKMLVSVLSDYDVKFLNVF